MLNRNRIIQNAMIYRSFNGSNNYRYQGDSHYLACSLKNWNITENQNFSVYIRISLLKNLIEYDDYYRFFSIFDMPTNSGIFIQLRGNIYSVLRNAGVENSIIKNVNIDYKNVISIFFVIDNDKVKLYNNDILLYSINRTLSIPTLLKNKRAYFIKEKDITGMSMNNVTFEETAIFQRALSEYEIKRIYNNEKMFDDEKCLVWSIINNKYMEYELGENNIVNIRFRDLSNNGNDLYFEQTTSTAGALSMYAHIYNGVLEFDTLLDSSNENYRSSSCMISARHTKDSIYRSVQKINSVRILEAVR